MADTEFVIVGAGLFGSVIATHLRSKGRGCVTLDDRRPLSGSRAAACLMKPSWASSMEKEDFNQAIRLLDGLYGVDQLSFKLPVGSTTVSWVNPSAVLRPPTYEARVTDIMPRGPDGSYGYIVNTDQGWSLFAERVIVATGIWVGELTALLETVTPKGGWAFLWNGRLKQPFISPWAPYKQLVAFNRGPREIWVGDGTALIPKSMDDEGRRLASKVRCATAVGLDPMQATVIAGYRPYVDGLRAPALVQEVRKNLWVATGGAKNGTLGAAWSARQLENV